MKEDQRLAESPAHDDEEWGAAELPEDVAAELPPRPMTNDIGSRSWSYLKSPDLRELLVTVAFFLLCHSIYLGESSMVNRLRPLPVQYLENSNEYVVNLTFNAEIQPEIVSTTALVLCTGVLPFFLQLLLSQIKNFRRIGDTHGTACVYFVAFGLTHFATQAIKVYVGYMRPIFFAVCEPSNDYQTCTNSQDNVDEVRLSFVSGHASSSFCGMMLLSRFIHQRFGHAAAKTGLTAGTECSTRPRVLRSPPLARLLSILSLAPLAVAIFIACSRVVDNHHHPADIVGGALLGGSIALFVSGLWL